jgi:pimeloyl-ACP methyl ester carboxylesterase
MAAMHKITSPHQHFGGQGQALHFASANGYPPGAYRAFLEPFAQSHEVVASLHRPLWDKPPAIESFTSWEMFGEDLCELVSQLRQPVISLGHSMGTATILMAAIQRPELFKSLILIEPVLVPRRYLYALKFFRRFSPNTIPLVKKTLARVDRFASRQEAFEHYRPKSVFSGISDEVLWDYVQHGIAETETGVFTLAYSRDWEARCYTLVHNLWNMLPQLRVPTLAIRAQGSNTLAMSSWEKWRAMSTNVDFLEVEDCGHLLPFEKPEQLSRAILAWIESRSTA